MKPVVKNGDTHLKIEKLLWRFTTSKLHMRLDNLFNGDKVLGECVKHYSLEIVVFSRARQNGLVENIIFARKLYMSYVLSETI